MENIVKTYPSGLRLIVCPMPGFKSIATSVLVGVGSRDELEGEHGISHFVEHMLFKGTKTRTSNEIANTLSGLGVDYNAWTSTNATCYHTKGLDSNVDTCCDILSDMYFNLQFKEEDFKRECEVIVQEIAMRDDHPRMSLGELCAETFFKGTQYGHNIAGTVEGIRKITSNDIYSYIKKHYVAPKTIISFAGDITVEQAEELMDKYFTKRFLTEQKPLSRDLNSIFMKPERQFVTRVKDIEQQNVAILFPAMNNNSDEKYAMSFVQAILAGDMSSRLFDSVRDRLGLVYTISGGLYLTSVGGYFHIFFSCTPKNTELVLKTIAEEIEKIRAKGVTDAEVQKIKNIKRSNTLFKSEDVEETNTRNATLLNEFNVIQTVEDYLENIESVSKEDVDAMVKKYLNFDSAIVGLVGKKTNIKPFVFLN